MMRVVKKEFTLLPPKPGLCQECAVQHAPQEPHNLHSMYYQARFFLEHHRLPTWADALAHCDAATQAVWRHELAQLGVEVEAGETDGKES